MNRRPTALAIRQIEITAEMDRSAVEALYLELGRLAGRYGVDIAGFRVEKVRGEIAGAGPLSSRP